MIKNMQLYIERYPLLTSFLKNIKKSTYSRYRDYKKNKLFHENAKELLEQVDKVFKELGIKYWLEFGTLLGAIREKGFIGHDLDIDLGVFLEDFKDENEEVFKKYGFKKTKEFLAEDGKFAREQTFEYKGVSVDIFYFKKVNNQIKTYTFIPEKNWSRDKTIQMYGGLLLREFTFSFTGFKEIDFLDKKFLSPKDTDLHLREAYGDDYMIPNPNFSDDEAPNMTILSPNIIVGKRKLYE